MVKITDHPDITSAVYRGRKARNQTKKQVFVFVSLSEERHIIQCLNIEKVTNDWKRLLKETTWMHVLDTVSPNGMNSKVLF